MSLKFIKSIKKRFYRSLKQYLISKRLQKHFGVNNKNGITLGVFLNKINEDIVLNSIVEPLYGSSIENTDFMELMLSQYIH